MLSFNDLIGQESLKKYFYKAISSDHISHAYIISGEKGMGKKTLADAFLLELLCENNRAGACRSCPGCKKVLAYSHPDIIYVKHEKINTISVDDIRDQVSDTILIKPLLSKYKIYIIDEADKMSIQAQNALLKTIEEPPYYAIIVMLAINEDAFLETIKSRCIKLKLSYMKEELIEKLLFEKFDLSKENLKLFSSFSRGNIGRAILLAESDNSLKVFNKLLSIARDILEVKTTKVLEYIEYIKEEDIQLKTVLELLYIWYRDILVFKSTKSVERIILKSEFKYIGEMARLYSYSDLNRFFGAIEKAYKRINFNISEDMIIQLLFLELHR